MSCWLVWLRGYGSWRCGSRKADARPRSGQCSRNCSFDEATEGLAPLIRAEIWQCLMRLKQAGQSILIIDKNVEALIRIADRHHLIERGRIVWSGTSHELGRAAELQHRYLGV